MTLPYALGTPPDVKARELDLFWLDLFTWASFAIAAAMLVWAVMLGCKHRTSFFVLACLSAALGAFVEPIYDVAFDLWFYDVHNGEPGAMYSHFTVFEIVQPIFTHTAYLLLYAGPCLYAGWRMYQGRCSAQFLGIVWAIEIATSCALEIVGTGFDVYTYWGPYETRLWNYPLVVGFLEGTQVVLFTVLMVSVWRKIRGGWGMASLLCVHPITMLGVNAGIGAPVILALHLNEPEFSGGAVRAAEFATIGLCALAVYGASKFLPEPIVEMLPTAPAPVRESVGV